MITVDRCRLRKLMEREEKNFVETHPRSKAIFERAKSSLLVGVPMNWMIRWARPHPIFLKEAKGAYVTDVDEHRYVDLCLGDTGAMFGHSPQPVVDAVVRQVRRGITMMLPTEDSIWVGEELERRFGLPYWQVALTATDANRFSIRLAREVTKRRKILVFNGCYHGSVDEALTSLKGGMVVPVEGNIGPPVDPAITTRVVEFNDLDALEAALAHNDVACVLCEPAMTNCGIILPELGYHDALRELTQSFGTLLIIDETHTICCGPGGYTAAYGLKPDIVTLGKPLGGGIPAAAYGMNRDVADRALAKIKADSTDESGVGGTLSGNALSIAAMRASLEHVITKQSFERMIPLADRLAKGVEEIIKAKELPWHVVRLGVRMEYGFGSTPPKNGRESEDIEDQELDKLMHLYALNRGILLTPFHNMTLISPYTTTKDVDLHTKIFGECVEELTSPSTGNARQH
ncbi:MAG: aspartate aminotransferase family protein [Candidatus Bathyarchaeota archaeon]|jgi:glutamate-1-semialdehyde 2,1-aminomutase